jgi:hypothetical protein
MFVRNSDRSGAPIHFPEVLAGIMWHKTVGDMISSGILLKSLRDDPIKCASGIRSENPRYVYPFRFGNFH